MDVLFLQRLLDLAGGHWAACGGMQGKRYVGGRGRRPVVRVVSAEPITLREPAAYLSALKFVARSAVYRLRYRH